MEYRPSEYRYKGKGRRYYLVYETMHPYRGGHVKPRPHINRVWISGKLIEFIF